MKYKSILLLTLATSTLVGVSSCEDMIKTESKVAVYEKDFDLSNATDSVYSLLGIIQKMQVIADRTVLLGELRGDLVSTTPYATSDLKDLNYFNFDSSTKNVYDNVADYYAVINNCNYFLSHADTTYTVGGRQIFKKEYIAILSFRAWTYLQLAQAYGEVPFVLEPITSGDESQISKYENNKLNIREIAQRLIPDLENCLGDNADTDFPSIGELTVNGTKYNSKKFYIPVRLILGDLYLWAGGKENAGKAAVCYHDYLVCDARNISIGTSGIVRWSSLDRVGNLSYTTGSYFQTFSTEQNGRDNNQICFIPMETQKYQGVVSDLTNIFNSTDDNNYYYQVSASDALLKLSSDQIYSYYYHNANNEDKYSIDTLYVLDKSKNQGEPDDFDKNYISSKYAKGDLRLSEVLSVGSRKTSNLNQSSSTQSMTKIKSDRICLYRNDVVYLRLAEALNRAEMPQMAFAILKYGLCETTINMISPGEISRANSIDPSLLDFPASDFGIALLKYGNGKYDIYAGSSVGNPSNTIGLHSRGSGDASSNKYYYIFNDKLDHSLNDSIRVVEEMILDEMGLETCFEGYRFGDLLRVSMHRAEDSGGGFADNAFLASKIGLRDNALGVELDNGGNFDYNPKLFLKLPK